MSTVPKTLTMEEEVKFVKYFTELAKDPSGEYLFLHHLVMVYLMLDAGLRLSEVIKLHWHNVMLGTTLAEAITISKEIAKGGYERIVPMTERLHLELALLCGIQKKSPHPWQTLPIIRHRFKTTATNKRQVERLVFAAGLLTIGRNVHPHMLRHTFATKLLKVTNIRTVQELLGHKRITSTQIYTHTNAEDCKKAIQQL